MWWTRLLDSGIAWEGPIESRLAIVPKTCHSDRSENLLLAGSQEEQIPRLSLSFGSEGQ
jgi:hypothetical protein